MLLRTTIDDKHLHTFGIVHQNCNKQKKRKTSKTFQNAMRFPLLHYTSKDEKKGHECCQNTNKQTSRSMFPIER
jgi:hypothetical protein